PLGSLGDAVARPSGEPLPGADEKAEANAAMWATADESREPIVGLYHRARAHADAAIEALPPDTVGTGPWWAPHRGGR
ncbi:hypothetical protein ACM9HB_35905, partial [Streptomyces sp. JAC128]